VALETEFLAKLKQEMAERKRAAHREARRATVAGLSVLAGVAAVVFSLAGAVVWLVDGTPASVKARSACDAAVRTLLDTRDALELQRADMLIRHLRCGVRRHLPGAPAPAS
jgi:hypothetical protein